MLNIDQKSFAAITAHAIAQYPNECCGVLLGNIEGQTRNVSHIAQCRNVHASPATRYAIDPAELISIQRNARGSGLEIIGFYHSHPDHPPVSSATDLAEAEWVGCSYLIVSVSNRTIEGTQAYQLKIDASHKRFTEEHLAFPSEI